MKPNENLAKGLLDQDARAGGSNVEDQVLQVRQFIATEQHKLRAMTRTWIGVALATQVLMWAVIIYFPAGRPEDNEFTVRSVLARLADSLFPVLIVAGMVALLLLHMWKKSRAETRLRLLEIESKLNALFGQGGADTDERR